MLAEIWQSFKDNVKRRATNPFLGTFTIVYILKNWELFYSLLNFDSNLNLEGRLAYVRPYFEFHSFVENILITVLITFVTLIVTYLLLSVARLLSNTYESIITPWIYKITDKSKIVLKDEHDKIKKQRSDFETNYEKEHEARIKIQAERDIYETKYHDADSRLIELIAESNSIKATHESLSSQLNASAQEIASLKEQSKDKDIIIEKMRSTIDEQLKLINNFEREHKKNPNLQIKEYEDKLRRLRLENDELKELKENTHENFHTKAEIKKLAEEIYNRYINLSIQSKRKLEDLFVKVREGGLVDGSFIQKDRDYLKFKNDGVFFNYKIEHDYYRIGLTTLGHELKQLAGNSFF